MLNFLTLHPSSFGLDISDVSLKIAHLEKSRQGFELSVFREFPMESGIVERGEILKEKELAQTIRESLKTIGEKKIATKSVVVSLPEEKAFMQVIQLPRMKKEELFNAVRFEAENYVPYSIESVYIDFQMVPPLSNHLDHVDVLLAALPKTTVDSYVQVLKRAGLLPSAMEVESLAVARALVPKETSPFPLLLVDLGATRTSFIVFSGHSIRFTTSIPVSSNEFTRAIVRKMKIKEEKAEELKIQYGLQKEGESLAREVFDALVPPLTDLTEQIQRYIDYYESHSAHQHLNGEKPQIKKIVLCGGGAAMKGLLQFLSKELEKKVILGNPWINISSISLKKLPPLPFGESARYATALGLALRGAKNE